MRRRKAGAGSMATTNCPSSFKVSGSPTGSKSPPTRRPLSPKPPPPEPSGHHQNSEIAQLEQGLTQFLDGLEGLHPQQVFLERADEPLGTAVAFRRPDEGGRTGDAEEGDLLLEVVGDVL